MCECVCMSACVCYLTICSTAALWLKYHVILDFDLWVCDTLFLSS